MISEGVNINGVNSYGCTGLIWATLSGKTEVSRILLSCNNIKIDIKDECGSTALHYACENNLCHNQALPGVTASFHVKQELGV